MADNQNTQLPTRNFTRLFSPRGIAVVGASDDPNKIGGQPMVFLTEYGYAGKVYPVNPRYTQLKGLPCYRELKDVPRPCDVALIGVGAQHAPAIVEQCGAAGIPFAVVMSAGFREAGEQGRELEERLAAAARRAGVRMLGPNCQGFVNIAEHVHCGFGSGITFSDLRPGPVAMIAQSGGFGFTLVLRAQEAGIGFSHAVTCGNGTDIDALELMQWFIERDEVEIVAAFIEGIADGRKLTALGRRALELGKPILICKGGNSASGRRAAASHTANLTADYSLYRAAFAAGGFIEFRDADDLIDMTRAFLGRKLPRSADVVIVTASGGSGVVLADRCEELGLNLPPLSDSTYDMLREVVSEFATLSNPLDISGQQANVANRALELVLADPAVSLAVVRSRQSTVDAEQARELVRLAEAGGKPVLVALGADRDQHATDFFDLHRLPWHMTVGRAAVAAAALAQFSAKRARFLAKPNEAPRIAARCELALPVRAGALSEYESKALLAAYGIACVREQRLSMDQIAALERTPLPFPLAVKIDSPDIAHKTEADAVRLNVTDLAQLKLAAREVERNARAQHPEARIEGVLVSEMASGTEVIAGVINDACFGPTVVLGLGGIFTELLRDVTHRFAPFDADTAREMIGEIKAAKLLTGYRGKPALDVDALADALVRLSLLASDHAGRIGEIDINPLFVRPAGQGVVAADALVVLREQT